MQSNTRTNAVHSHCGGVQLKRGRVSCSCCLKKKNKKKGGGEFTTSFSYIRVGAEPLIQPWEGDRRTGLEKPN